MRVLVTAEQLQRPVPGGVATYVRGLLQGLAQEPSAADVVVAGARDAPPRVEGHPVVASPLPVSWLTLAWDRGLVRPRAEADVVHATSLAVPPTGRRPLSVFVHDVAWRRVPDAYPARGRRWHEAALARAVRRARLLLVPSRPTADDLVAGGVPAARVEVVEEGCDHLPAPDHEAATALLRARGVGHGYLLAVSTLEPRKNLTRLLEAFRLARPHLPEPWPLVVVGPEGWGDRLVAPPGVVLTGPVPAAVLAALYAGARAVAYVPLLEGFGLPAVEAMLACVPVVASPVPSTGGAAIEVDPFDVPAIAHALVAAATDDAVRAERVTAGLLRAEELTWAAAARRHVELWSGLVGT
jgi:glycosyltransferase involved in cell wall biosynthesis